MRKGLDLPGAGSSALSLRLWCEPRCHGSFPAGTASCALEKCEDLYRKSGSEAFSWSGMLGQSKGAGAMQFMTVTRGEML